MEELERILRVHAARYRKMQPEDAVKLIYQNEFGSGHFLRDPEEGFRLLKEEFRAVKKDPERPRFEEIGGGLLRVNLQAAEEGELERIWADFVRVAETPRGSLPAFRKKLEVLSALTEEGVFSFSSPELRKYLLEYEKAGYPVVSHSRVYHEAYCPAYRLKAVL